MHPMPSLVFFHESTYSSSSWDYSLVPNLTKLQTMETKNMDSKIDTFVLSICDWTEFTQVPTPENFEHVHTLYVLYGRVTESYYIDLLKEILTLCKNLKRFAVAQDDENLFTLRELDEIETREYVDLNGILDLLPWVPTPEEVMVLHGFGDSEELRKIVALNMFKKSGKATHLYRQEYVDIELEILEKILSAI